MKKSEKFVEAVCSILEKNEVIAEKEAVDLKRLFKESLYEDFEDFLLQEGLVQKDDLLKALSTYYKVPSFDVMGHFFDHYLVVRFPKDFLLRNEIIPLQELNENMLVVVAANPDDESLLPEIGSFDSSDIQFMVGIAEDIIESIEEFYDQSLQVSDDFDYISAEEEEEARELAREKNILDEEE